MLLRDVRRQQLYVIGWSSLLVLGLVRAAAAQGTPDLVLDTDLLAATTSFDVGTFPDAACELQAADRCLGAAGARKLLRFSVQVANLGTADLVLGKPPDVYPPNGGAFVYSACHMHYHFETFARFELRQRGTTAVVAPGEKRSFCIEDDVRLSGASEQRYCCDPDRCGGVQGVQVGWADLYPRDLSCQWIDVTDVPAGDYDLCVAINTAGLIAEDPAGDFGCVPVTLSPARRSPPRVRVSAPRAHTTLRVGQRLRVVWKKRVHGRVLFEDVWLSRDGGTTYASIGRLVPPPARGTLRVPVTSDMATDAARLRVYVCVRNPPDDPGAGALQCAGAESRFFRISP